MWLPLALGAMQGTQALGGALGGGATGTLQGYQGPIHSAKMLERGAGDISQLGGIMTERAGSPVAFPSAGVGLNPIFPASGGMPMSIFTSGQDVSVRRPSLLARPGVRFGSPDYGAEKYPERYDDRGQLLAKSPDFGNYQGNRWMFPDAPRQTGMRDIAKMAAIPGVRQPYYEGLRQPPESLPEMGGGLPELAASLELLGVKDDALGNLTLGREYPAFTGKRLADDFPAFTGARVPGWKEGRDV